MQSKAQLNDAVSDGMDVCKGNCKVQADPAYLVLVPPLRLKPRPRCKPEHNVHASTAR